jgi:hypothetical protein
MVIWVSAGFISMDGLLKKILRHLRSFLSKQLQWDQLKRVSYDYRVTMSRILTYFACIIAASDLIFFSLFITLPTLEVEPLAGLNIATVVIAGGLILSVISVLVVGMLISSRNENVGLSTSFPVVQKISGLILIAFALFVFSYLINVFRSGI